MSMDFIDAVAVKGKESEFEMERRKGTLLFAFVFFFVCCCFTESYVARFAVDAVATVGYWKWAGGLDASLNYMADDDEVRYHRAVIRVEKLTTLNSTLLLMMFVVLGLWQIGRWVDGPQMCNPKCHWCKERIAEENTPDYSYNPQGRE